MTADIMMDTLREVYHKYDEIIRLSAYAFTGWFLSWVLFFIMLPFMIRYYGKIRGASLNYGFSWFSMIAIILGLEFTLGWFQTFNCIRTNYMFINEFSSKNISFEISKSKTSDFKTSVPYFSKTFRPKIFRSKLHPQKMGILYMGILHWLFWGMKLAFCGFIRFYALLLYSYGIIGWWR